MEPIREIVRVFPNCRKCGNILAQCYCAASRNSREGLKEYMAVREEIYTLEGMEDQCKCGDFYTCDLCREMRDKEHHASGLMKEWGDDWAVRLSTAAESEPAGQGGWIPVGERLPELSEWVLVVYSGQIQRVMARRLQNGSGWEWEWSDLDADHAPSDAMSHWMPLPESPK